jgi:hypothetical protein
MSKKRYINTVFWDDSYIANLDPSEKLIFIYLITNPCTNISGIYQIPIKRIALDTGIDKDMVLKILERFSKDNKAHYKDGWIKVVNFIKHQNIKSPCIVTAIENELENVPEELRDGIGTVLNSTFSISKSKDISKFTIPSEEELQAHLDERHITAFSGRQFIDFYESKGWMIGKNRMRDWKAAVRTWVQRVENKPKPLSKTEQSFRPEILDKLRNMS